MFSAKRIIKAAFFFFNRRGRITRSRRRRRAKGEALAVTVRSNAPRLGFIFKYFREARAAGSEPQAAKPTRRAERRAEQAEVSCGGSPGGKRRRLIKARQGRTASPAAQRVGRRAEGTASRERCRSQRRRKPGGERSERGQRNTHTQEAT